MRCSKRHITYIIASSIGDSITDQLLLINTYCLDGLIFSNEKKKILLDVPFVIE